MNLKNRPHRKVVESYFSQSKYCKPGHGSTVLKLECGHEIARKASIRIPKKAHCYWCDRETTKMADPPDTTAGTTITTSSESATTK